MCSVEKYHKTRLLTEKSTFFRQINGFTNKEVTKELISRKFLSVIAFYTTFPHCTAQYGNYLCTEIVSHAFFWQRYRESNALTK